MRGGTRFASYYTMTEPRRASPMRKNGGCPSGSASVRCAREPFVPGRAWAQGGIRGFARARVNCGWTRRAPLALHHAKLRSTVLRRSLDHAAHGWESRQSASPRAACLSLLPIAAPIPPQPLRRPAAPPQPAYPRPARAYVCPSANTPASRARTKPGEAHMRLLPALFTIRRRAARLRTCGRRRSGRRPGRASRGAPGSICPWHRGSGS